MTRYRTIVADPPWPIGDFPQYFVNGTGGTIQTAYDTMTIREIAALPVGKMSDNEGQDAHLYLWTINEYLEESFGVARAWGFHHSATLTWCKPPRPGGLGGVFPSNCEYVLFCRRGKFTDDSDVRSVLGWMNDRRREAGVTLRDLMAAGFTEGQLVHWTRSSPRVNLGVPTWDNWQRLKRVIGFGDTMDESVRAINARKGTKPFEPYARADSRWFEWPVAGHSRKPDAFLDLVEQVSPGPYLELFARRQRLGWDTWGDEALDHTNGALALKGEARTAPAVPKVAPSATGGTP